ncbi:ATP-binding protein [Crossiella sp. SN42]|nr:ATP-binding protein [Crossiella sp. SN42]MCO1575904.1 ATP-binding protein [Crossiella sp. SN42]
MDLGGDWAASFAVTGYPREVGPGWLQPLSTYPGRLDVSLHIEPIDPVTAAHRLRTQLGRLDAENTATQEHGGRPNPLAQAAAEDAEELSHRIACGQGKLFRLGLYLTVHAGSEEELIEEIAAVHALTASLLLEAAPCSYRALQGWVSTLPLALDQIGLARTFDTAALATTFPFASPDLPPADPADPTRPAGVLYGFNLGSQSLVHWDRFACHSYNTVVLGRSGSGKSYLVKLDLLRNLYRGVQGVVIDPEAEYLGLAEAVGGTTIPLGRPGIRLNPFDLPVHTGLDGRRSAPADTLLRRCLFLHTVLAVLLGADLTASQRAVADVAITATYHRAGITADPRTWTRPAPLLHHLATVLAEQGEQGGELAARLRPFTQGAFSELFSGPTTTVADGHLVVFSLRELAAELRPIGTLLALDAVWRQVSNPATRRPRIVVVDEAWMLMRQPAGAEFALRLAKAGRKHYAGFTFCSQDAADVLGSQAGLAIVANASTQILLRQAPQTAETIAAAFALSDGERQFLLSCDRGQALLLAGTHRLALQSLASPREHALCTTDPAELAASATDQAHRGEAPADLLDLDTA